MDVTLITQLIGSVGFPIVACIMIFRQMTKQEDMHREEMEGMKDSLNNNTIALTKLVDRLDAIERNVEND